MKIQGLNTISLEERLANVLANLRQDIKRPTGPETTSTILYEFTRSLTAFPPEFLDAHKEEIAKDFRNSMIGALQHSFSSVASCDNGHSFYYFARDTANYLYYLFSRDLLPEGLAKPLGELSGIVQQTGSRLLQELHGTLQRGDQIDVKKASQDLLSLDTCLRERGGVDIKDMSEYAEVHRLLGVAYRNEMEVIFKDNVERLQEFMSRVDLWSIMPYFKNSERGLSDDLLRRERHWDANLRQEGESKFKAQDRMSLVKLNALNELLSTSKLDGDVTEYGVDCLRGVMNEFVKDSKDYPGISEGMKTFNTHLDRIMDGINRRIGQLSVLKKWWIKAAMNQSSIIFDPPECLSVLGQYLDCPKPRHS